jgi:hypothetical protein
MNAEMASDPKGFDSSKDGLKQITTAAAAEE